MFGLSSLMSMFSEPQEPGPEIDLHEGRRQRLIRMVKRSSAEAPAVEPGTHPSRRDEAAAFVGIANRRLGIVGLGIDAESVTKLDAYLDATAMTHPISLSRCQRQIASWLGEVARRSHGLAWDGEILTDGRVAFDPDAAVRARLSPERTRMATSLEHALTVSTIRSAA